MSKKHLRILGIALIIIGLVVVIYPAYTFYFASKAQGELEKEWKGQVQAHSQKPDGTNETSTEPTDSTGDSLEETVETKTPARPQKIIVRPAFRLIIPSINLDRVVVEGTDYAHLRYGPGHMKGSAYPGERGVSVISGHRTTYGAPFYHLDKLKKGDEIILETLEDRFVYLVEKIASLKPDDLSILEPTVEPTLILTTCTPIRSASKRLVVFASLSNP